MKKETFPFIWEGFFSSIEQMQFIAQGHGWAIYDADAAIPRSGYRPVEYNCRARIRKSLPDGRLFFGILRSAPDFSQ